MKLLEKAGAGASLGYVATVCAALLVSAPAARAQLRMAITFAPVPSDSTAPLAVSLLIRPRADSVLTLQLPNEWAGRTQLFRRIVDLGTPTRGARIDATDRPDRVRLVADPRRDVVVTWRVKATTPPSSSTPDGHNHSDIGRAWAQVVAHDALVLPALDDGTPVVVDVAFRDFDRNAVVASSFGTPSSPGATVTARAQLGSLQETLYDVGATPGALRSYRSTIAGGKFTILIRGHLSIDDSALVNGVRRVVQVERGFWRTPAPPNYLVSIGVAPRGSIGGQRLTNAFVANIDSTRRMDDAVLGLFTHELMHDWIGGVLFASPAIPDGSLSWFTEGFTEFATHRVMRASGMLSDSAYIATINHILVEHAISAARDSSWTAIVTGYWRDKAMQREPYVRGELIGLELNAAMLRATNGRMSLDSTLRRMTAQRDRFPNGFTQETLMEQLGAQIGSAVARAIVEPVLAGAPIALSADALGACVLPTLVQQTTWDPGFDIDASMAAKRVVRARPGGPAALAGLRDSMALLGVDITRGDPTRKIRLRVRAGTDTTRVEYLPAGTPVTVQQWSRTPGCDGTTP
jgi:hypothetical protein